MVRRYRSRHNRQLGNSPWPPKYSSEALAEMRTIRSTLPIDKTDSTQEQALLKRGNSNWTQVEAQLFDDIQHRKEEYQAQVNAPLARELESYFSRLNLPPLPPPMAKSSLWLQGTPPSRYPNPAVRPFLLACESGDLETVKQWVNSEEKKDFLQPIGLRDGLACAAQGNALSVVEYLLTNPVAPIALHGAVIKAAIQNRSLALFKLCVTHGYHPNQAIPSPCGAFGTALIHCLDSEDITEFLLDHGADPNVAHFLDNRKAPWSSERAVVPLDRASGLALEIALEEGRSVRLIRMLLDHGLEPRYSRPLTSVLFRVHRRLDIYNTLDPGKSDWRPLMELMIERGVGPDANSRREGAAVPKSIRGKRWDIVEFLLDKGASAKLKDGLTGLDAVETAAADPDTPPTIMKRLLECEEQIETQLKEQSKKQSQDQANKQPNKPSDEQPGKQPEEQSTKLSNEQPGKQPKEDPKEHPKDHPREEPKEHPKDHPKEHPKEQLEEHPKAQSNNPSKTEV